jgi:hypothetical protein
LNLFEFNAFNEYIQQKADIAGRMELIRSVEKTIYRLGTVSANGRVRSLGMKGLVRRRQDKYGSPRGATTVPTVFLRRITVHRGVVEDFPLDSGNRQPSDRLWISSSMSGLFQSYFSNCTSLPSITFESNSKLQRIDESAFTESDLTTIHVPASVEVLCKNSFSNCKSLASITFESNSKLQRIEESAFVLSGLTTIHVPASVEVLCQYCFCYCKSLTLITFESNSKLQRIAESAFAMSDLTSNIIVRP